MNNSLRNSISLDTVILFCIQTALLVLCSRIFTTLPNIQGWFSWIIITHIGLLIFLFVRKQDFIIIEQKRLLDSINTANILTMFRLSSAPVLHYLLVASGTEKKALIGVLVFAVIISLSDMFDGILARKNQITPIGKYMDPMADYYILLTVSFAMSSIQLLPSWLLSLIVARLSLQAFFAAIIITKQKRVMHSTVLGKILVGSVFFLYNFSLLKLFNLQLHPAIFYIQVLVALLLLASMVERIIIFLRWGKERRTASSTLENAGNPKQKL